MSGVPLDTSYMKLGVSIMTRKHRLENSRFADSYLPYGLFVLISIVSLALAGCSGASPRAEVPEPTTATPVTPDAPRPSTESTVTILADSDTVEAGQLVSYTVNASPAPTADLTVHVAYRNTGVELAEELPATITINAGSGAEMLTVPTAPTSPGGTITASVTEDDGYTVGTARSASVTVTASPTGDGSTTGPDITGPVITEPVIIRPPPPANSVTITAVTDSVVEGNPVRFRVTATPAPAVELMLSVSFTETDPTRTTGTPPPSVTIPASTGSVVLTLTTTDDNVAESDGTVTARLDSVTPSSTYSIRSPASATVTVTDNDDPLQNHRSTATIEVPDSVTQGGSLTITVHMMPALGVTQTVPVEVFDFGPPAADRVVTRYDVPFAADTTSQTVTHPVIMGYASATGRIIAGIFPLSSGAPYDLGEPSWGSVDVTD